MIKKTELYKFMMVLMIFAMAFNAGAKSKHSNGEVQSGMVTWYGGKGDANYKLTANGEKFDRSSMTAAHRSLPFGTMVRATRVDTGASAMFRINNRGPFVRNRILDVTPAGADVLDLRQDGAAKIKLEVVSTN